MADDDQAPQAPLRPDGDAREAPDPSPAETPLTSAASGEWDERDERDERAQPADPPARSTGVTGWLRGALARLPSASRPLPADPLGALDAQLAASASAASAALDPLSRATRAGEIIAALAPGAPGGVTAPEGAPRVARVIGRDDDLARALMALASGASLCVHSAGVPGVGKTIFAVELASRAAEHTGERDGARALFGGGAAWISCEALSGDGGLAEVITRVARGLREERALAALDPDARQAELLAGLRSPDRPATLLALDNVEPTLDIAALLDTLSGGYATLLLTTRQPIDDARLTSFALAPLASPYAEQLLAERLRLRATQRPLPEEATLIEPLSQALGGLPLLIELAAAMAGVYATPLDATLAEAQADGARGATVALRARIDRLWLALSPTQRRALLGLTLIEGATFPRAVALAVARVANQSAADDASRAEARGIADDVTEGWRALAAQTLDALIGVGAVEALAAGRLRLHPQTRQRVAPRLSEEASEIQRALGQAMAGWWLAYARDHGGYEGRAGLEAEAAGLMGALTWAHAQGEPRLTLDLAESLGEAWRAHGRRDEALRIASWAAQAADAEGQPSERLWARYQLAVAQTEAGRLEQARAGFAEALKIARELGDRLAIRDGAHALAALAARLGDAEQARAGFAEALALARAMQDDAAIRDELHGLAILDAQAGALDAAHTEYTEALALARALGDPAAIALELHGLALVQMRQGELEPARASFVEALALASELGDHAARIDALSNLGALDAQRDQPDLAREELEQALALAQQLRDARRAARALVWLGEIEAASGSASAAVERFQLAHALYERLGDAEAARVAERIQSLGDSASASG